MNAIVKLYGGLLDIVLIGDKAALDYHSLLTIDDLRCVDRETDELFDVILRIGQPFSIADIHFSAVHAPVNIFFMLDTIAADCGHLRSPTLIALWDYVSQCADGIIYNSLFTNINFVGDLK